MNRNSAVFVSIAISMLLAGCGSTATTTPTPTPSEPTVEIVSTGEAMYESNGCAVTFHVDPKTEGMYAETEADYGYMFEPNGQITVTGLPGSYVVLGSDKYGELYRGSITEGCEVVS